MNIFQLTLLYSVLFLSASDSAVKTVATPPVPAAGNIIYRSNDGGLTWKDITQSLPVKEQPEDFFAGEDDVYVRIKNETYRSNSTLETPVWEKENVAHRSTIAFNKSGAMAYCYDGFIYRKKTASETWLPIYPNLKSKSVATFFEASDGSVFLSTGRNFFKSADNATNWKQVQIGGVQEIVESEGVLIATGQKGIMRSTDNGENWEWVISEGGVGIAIEKIKGGFAAIAYNSKTKSRRIHLSMDAGKTWQVLDGLPHSASISSIKQVGRYLICGHPDGIFRTSDHGKTWIKVHSGVDENQFTFMKIGNTNPLEDKRKVFKIYVSGSVVYAVAREFGC